MRVNDTGDILRIGTRKTMRLKVSNLYADFKQVTIFFLFIFIELNNVGLKK